jgi:hypothetical protein
MSHENEIIYEDDLDVNDFKTADKVLESVDGLQKWLSAVEDKVATCSDEIEYLHEIVLQNEKTLLSVLDSVKELTREVRTKDRIKRMTECNRELGLALSAKLYRSDAKRLKTNAPIPPNTFHPSVLPFIFSDSESTEEEKEESEEEKVSKRRINGSGRQTV